ncbi:hypothetical protein F5Y06DRAFT_277362 [Hypoxylon sp. FL0890]|nr:hypothetical protein F5Y06DRAFT_277362 [Hypoxylon sp. FL0890]
MMGVTLTSKISLHEPMAKADEWMPMERDISSATMGRIAIYQRIWDVSSGWSIMTDSMCLSD